MCLWVAVVYHPNMCVHMHVCSSNMICWHIVYPCVYMNACECFYFPNLNNEDWDIIKLAYNGNINYVYAFQHIHTLGTEKVVYKIR